MTIRIRQLNLLDDDQRIAAAITSAVLHPTLDDRKAVRKQRAGTGWLRWSDVTRAKTGKSLD